jgi:hypothetical protein
MHRAWFTVLLTAALAVPVTASAQNRPWLSAGVGYHTYGMEDVNDSIELLNDIIFPYEMDEIGSGWGFGAGVGVDMPTFSLGLGYERLTASSEVTDDIGTIEFDLPANLWTAQAVFRPGSYGTSMGFGIGVSAGLIVSEGEIRTSETGFPSETQELEGSGGAFAGFLTADFPLTPNLALVPSIGYRYAKISEVESDGEVLYNDDGSKFELDYSGLLAKVALKLSL